MFKRTNNKHAQTGGSAATLVAVIAAIILLYILFLPPADRELLLEGNITDSGITMPSNNSKTLLLENVGRLDFASEDEIVHNIPSINLYTKTEPRIIKRASDIYVKRGWFDKVTKNFTFDLNPQDSNNVLLSFLAKDRKGILTISVNGHEIFSSKMSSGNVNPIEIPKSYLSEKNIVDISVSDVGWKFWTVNEYSLSDIKITADITDRSGQESKTVFVVTSTERENLERSTLKFVPDCSAGSGVLDVFINNHNIYSSVPDCGISNSVDFSRTYILNGENKLVFSSNGKYLIDRISVKSELKESSYPVYYFTISDEEYRAILDNRLDVNLTIEFVDDLEYKKAKLVINGIETHIDQKDRIYSKQLDIYVQKGNNALELIPSSVLDIVKLRVDLVG